MTKDKKTLCRDRKADKVVRYFKGRKVELPLVEKPVDNKVTINPETENIY